MPRTFEGNLVAPRGRFGLCVSRFNGLITEELLRGAVDALSRHGVPDASIDIYRVPGTFELPPLLRRLAEKGAYAGLVALGAIIRGGTPHFEFVSSEVTKGIGQVAYSARCAVALGVLTCDTLEQALDRAGVKAGNKGAEAALACLEMVNLFEEMGSAEAKKK
jgi:6,7-dimethyl-8-ribityllumazine synthase